MFTEKRNFTTLGDMHPKAAAIGEKAKESELFGVGPNSMIATLKAGIVYRLLGANGDHIGYSFVCPFVSQIPDGAGRIVSVDCNYEYRLTGQSWTVEQHCPRCGYRFNVVAILDSLLPKDGEGKPVKNAETLLLREASLPVRYLGQARDAGRRLVDTWDSGFDGDFQYGR